ncbi:hypothetical protein ElyMa_002195900 [Elysia marginata]|uniref:Uncharacterized protein n=1 Tax=Elysia marginata TaxID=1093978 RepID=A0AAV4FQZ5_9GAST|nr:hypothetical protein ElyMa_002195900 [Elysia marginata]
MPFKALFWGHKRNKQSSKRGVHFMAEHHNEGSEEPPDRDLALDQISHMKLHKQEAPSSRSQDRQHMSRHTRSSDPTENGTHNGDFIPPPLNRAATAPLPVTTDALAGTYRAVRRVRRSFSLGERLDASEIHLHDKRLKEITQLENYIHYLQQSPEDEDACHMSNRLCCAQVLKTLYLRHEQRYVNFLKHSKSPDSHPYHLQSDLTKQDGEPKATECGTCSTHLQDDLDIIPHVSYGTDGHAVTHDRRRRQSALKKPGLNPSDSSANFCRQTGSRLPVAPRRSGLRVSLCLTPQSASPQTPPQFDSHEGENLVDNQCSLDQVLGESSPVAVAKSVALSDQSRCSSDLSLTSFSTMAVFPGNYEIY